MNFLTTHADVKLKNAPLIAVVSQVNFGELLTVNEIDKIKNFQTALNADYPVFKDQKGKSAHIDLVKSEMNITDRLAYKFSNIEQTWHIAFSTESISLEAKRYTTKEEFKARFSAILSAFTDIFQPKINNRLGLRYVNRISGELLNNPTTYINPSLLGVSTSELQGNLEASISEALMKVENDHQLFAKWGFLPGASTTDPALIKPIREQSWILDLDSSTTKIKNWSMTDLNTELDKLAQINYNFFRWAVTNDLLKACGGNV